MTGDAWNNFGETVLHVKNWGRAVDLRRPLPIEDRAFFRSMFSVHCFAVVTAANPLGRVLTIPENETRFDLLRGELEREALPHWPVDGMNPDGTHIEKGFALEVPQELAIALARRWDQLGMFWFDGERMWIVPVLADRMPTMLPACQ